MASTNRTLGTEILTSGIQDPVIADIEPAKVRYLGPNLSFSHEMATILFGISISDSDHRRAGWKHPQYTLERNLPMVFESLAHDQSASLTVGVVPIENTPTGAVPPVVDALFTRKFNVIAEAGYLVRIMVASNATDLSEVTTIYSQPQPLAQASGFLGSHRFKIEETPSTSRAAQKAAGEDGQVAALCGRRAAEQYGLTIIAEDVQDDPDNQTRFLVVKSRDGVSGPDLGQLTRSGKLASRQLVKVAGIISPTKPAARDGYMNATGHLGEMGVHVSSLGKRNSQRDNVGGDREHMVELTGRPQQLFDVLRNPSNYNDFMAFHVIGVYAVGRLFASN